MKLIDFRKKISTWLNNNLRNEHIPENVIALNFGMQKVFDGYEFYQCGCNEYYENHDTWLLSVVYEPKDNFLNLGLHSLVLIEKEMYELYKKEIQNLITHNKEIYPSHLKYITVNFNSPPELLEKRT